MHLFKLEYSRLLRCCTARGPSIGFYQFSPNKVQAPALSTRISLPTSFKNFKSIIRIITLTDIHKQAFENWTVRYLEDFVFGCPAFRSYLYAFWILPQPVDNVLAPVEWSQSRKSDFCFEKKLQGDAKLLCCRVFHIP